MSTELYTDEQRDQFYTLLETYPDAVAGLRAALVEGRIDGAWYGSKHGNCGCVIGTIAVLRNQLPSEIIFFSHFETAPIEKLVFAINEGDTPATNPVSALLVAWIDSARPGLAKDVE